eukprot:jgi/Tetstr1/434883/TSEL_023880.t1
MIDFACVSSTTPTAWSNDPRWCNPRIAATEAEQGKLAADRASSALVQGVHRYYPFVVEDRGRLGKPALTVVYIFFPLDEFYHSACYRAFIAGVTIELRKLLAAARVTDNIVPAFGQPLEAAVHIMEATDDGHRSRLANLCKR